MKKYILGIQSIANHNSGARIFEYNTKKFTRYIALTKKRLIRKKHPYTFPVHSILYCMKYFKIKS